MILATFANAHLAHIGEIDHRSDEKPVGALILSMQAVSGSGFAILPVS
jgi:hypothetical protein